MTVTNAMRLLTQAGIPFETSEYPVDENDLSGVHAAEMLGVDADCVFKTLVVRGERKGICVFVIPVAEELDLKKAARASGEKAIAMIKQKELLPLTGYVHGGCSPLGMKKPFPTFLHETAILYETIFVSAGKVGYQIEISPDDLITAAACRTEDLIT